MTDAELQAILLDVRPRPEAAWAARLDSQVERGFPAPVRRPRRAWSVWRMPALAAGLACAVALLIVFGPSGHAPESSSGGGGRSSFNADHAAPQRSAGSSASSAAPAPAPAAAPVRRRAVERSAELILGAPRDRVSQVADGVVHATEAAGGFVATSNVSTGTYAGASFTLRIPEPRLARTLSALSALGHVRSLTQSGEDITDVIAAARGRLRDRLAERASLRRQLAQTSDPTTAAKLQRRLRHVARQVEAARHALAHQRSRASLSTVLLTVKGERRAGSAGGAWTPGDALHDAGRVLEVAAGVALVAGAAALPLALLGAAAWAAVRVGARRRRERLLDMA